MARAKRDNKGNRHGGGKRSEGSELRAVVVELKKAKRLIDKNLANKNLERNPTQARPSAKATARQLDWKRSEVDRKAHGQVERRQDRPKAGPRGRR